MVKILLIKTNPSTINRVKVDGWMSVYPDTITRRRAETSTELQISLAN